MAKKKEAEKSYFDLGSSWSVDNVRKLKFGTFFTLRIPGLALYNLKVVPAGDNYDVFIGMPEDKGNDGDYYKRFALYLSEDDTAEVIREVKAALKDSKKPKKARKARDDEEESEEE